MSFHQSAEEAERARGHAGGELTRDENVLVVLHEVLDDALGALDNIHISPVNPRVLRLQRGAEEEVPGLAHCLPPGTLEFKRVPHGNILAFGQPIVLLHNGDTVERAAELRIGLGLDTVQFRGEDGKGIIAGVGYQKCEVDEFVGIRQLRNELKVFGKVVCGVTERSEYQYPFLVLDGVGGRRDLVQVDVLNGARIDLNRLVMVEQYRCLVVHMPFCVLVL